MSPYHSTTRSMKIGRANCCCAPLFGDTCLLPEFLGAGGSLACLCPEIGDFGASLQLLCDAYCTDGATVAYEIGPDGRPVSNPDNKGCTEGWGYHCNVCSDGKIITSAPGGGPQIPACNLYCCAQWRAIVGQPPTQGPGGDSGLDDLCTVDSGTGLPNKPCVTAIQLLCTGSAPNSSVPCKRGPKIPYTDSLGIRHGGCNWFAVVFFSSLWFDPGTNTPENCAGPCFNPTLSSAIAFAIDCGIPDAITGQGNILGCDPSQKATAGDSDTILDPVTGLYRKKMALHMTPIGQYDILTGDVAPFTCSATDLLGCYLDISE